MDNINMLTQILDGSSVLKKKQDGKGKWCCVPNCNSRQYQMVNASREATGISFFEFPQDINEVERWCNLIRRQPGRDGFNLTKSTRVCMKHFLPESIKKAPGSSRRSRISGSEPVLFAWNNFSLEVKQRKVAVKRMDLSQSSHSECTEFFPPSQSDDLENVEDEEVDMEFYAADNSTNPPKTTPNEQESSSNHVLNLESSTMSSASPRNDLSQDDDLDDDDDDDENEKKEELKSGNPERLKAFNMFVRLFIDENLDRLVPISKQPKEKVQAIIQSCQRQFPEFSDRARKRIRTYLKSCRRSTRLREPAVAKPLMAHIPPSQQTEVNAILAEACQNEAVEAAKRQRSESVDVKPNVFSAVSTEKLVHRPISCKAVEPATKTVVNNIHADAPALPAFIASSLKTPMMKLSQSEVKSMKNLIDGYRQSASFLHRSADELERILKQCEAYSDNEDDSGSKSNGKQSTEQLTVDVNSVPNGSSSSFESAKIQDGASATNSVKCTVPNVIPIRSAVANNVSFTANAVQPRLEVIPQNASSSQHRDFLVQPTQELVVLPVRVSDIAAPPPAKRFFTSSPVDQRVMHIASNDARNSPNPRVESPLSHIHGGLKNAETKFQAIAPSIPVTLYSPQKHILVHHSAVAPMSGAHVTPQHTILHGAPQVHKIAVQQLPPQPKQQQQQQQQPRQTPPPSQQHQGQHTLQHRNQSPSQHLQHQQQQQPSPRQQQQQQSSPRQQQNMQNRQQSIQQQQNQTGNLNFSSQSSTHSNYRQSPSASIQKPQQQFATVHHQSTSSGNYENSSPHHVNSRAQIVQLVAPAVAGSSASSGINYHQLPSPQGLQEPSRQPPHIQEINHQPILQEMGRPHPSHTEYGTHNSGSHSNVLFEEQN